MYERDGDTAWRTCQYRCGACICMNSGTTRLCQLPDTIRQIDDATTHAHMDFWLTIAAMEVGSRKLVGREAYLLQ